MQALYVFFLFCSTSQLHDLIKYCFYLPLRVSFGLVANVLHCLLALLGSRAGRFFRFKRLICIFHFATVCKMAEPKNRDYFYFFSKTGLGDNIWTVGRHYTEFRGVGQSCVLNVVTKFDVKAFRGFRGNRCVSIVPCFNRPGSPLP